MPIADQTDFFLNFQQFGDLKLLARQHSDEAARGVARQFEGLFVQQMLSAMRAANRIDDGRHSSYLDFYQDMYDKQVAQLVAKQDSLGVARMILRQLPDSEAQPEPPAVDGPYAMAKATAAETVAVHPVTSVKRDPNPVGHEGTVILNKVVDDDFAEQNRFATAPRWPEPAGFVADIWPQARVAARRLGVSPNLLVAQAALETGWGKHMMKLDDGRDSFNLFGIKAGPPWQGGTLSKKSLEYRDGFLSGEVSHFRAYASIAQSLDDYVDLIQSSPRYRPALQQAGDDQAYIRELQAAGYATDPAYADKVLDILDGELLRTSLAAIDLEVGNNV